MHPVTRSLQILRRWGWILVVPLVLIALLAIREDPPKKCYTQDQCQQQVNQGQDQNSP